MKEVKTQQEDNADGKGWSQITVIMALSSLGRKEEAKKLLLELSQDSCTIKIPALGIAIAHAYLDDKDKAFLWLNRAYENRDFWLTSLKTYPSWDKIRNDPPFPGIAYKNELSGLSKRVN